MNQMDKTTFNRRRRQFKEMDLVGISDIARMLGWELKKATLYKTRGKFPEPLGEVGGRPVWFRAQVAPVVKKLLEIEEGKKGAE